MPDPNAKEVPMVGGIVSSSKIPGLHLIPTEGLLRTAARFDLGTERKGDKAWNALSSNQECLLDRAWAIERIGHVINHALKLRDRLLKDEPLLGDGVDDDAGALGWSAMFLCCVTRALQDLREGKSKR